MSAVSTEIPKSADIVIVGAGHNGLVAACLLSAKGFQVVVCEDKDTIGGACRTESPFPRAPELRVSTGAYILGLMPPELMGLLGVSIPLLRRDPHYFLPTTDNRYLMFGSDRAEMQRQFLKFFSEQDWRANCALQEELEAIRDDIAPSWLTSPVSIEESAEKYIRPALRDVFVKLCRGTVSDYLDRFEFKSDLIRAMYAVTDAFSGLAGGLDTPGTGMNFLVHNMCRLPGSDGTWMIVKGGMGTVTQSLASRARELGAKIFSNSGVHSVELQSGAVTGVMLSDGRTIKCRAVISNGDPYRTRALVPEQSFDKNLSARLDTMKRDGATFKVNLAFEKLPTFRCLPEDRGQFGPTIHLLPDESTVIAEVRRAHAQAMRGELPDFPTIEWYFHTPLDPTLKDPQGRHNGALFVQWVPYQLADGKEWSDVEQSYVKHLLGICDRFAPGTSDLIVDAFALPPPGIEQHFGITRGHIHHLDNSYGFSDRAPYRFGVPGLYLCSAGTHPAGSVIGAAGHNAAQVMLEDFAR